MTFTEDRNATDSLDLDGFTVLETAAAVPDAGTYLEVDPTTGPSEVGSRTGVVTPLDPDRSTPDGGQVEFGVGGTIDDTWEDLAACRTAPGGTEVFFSEELTDIVAAKAICADCPVIAPCLEGALLRAEPCGVWGGQLFSNGKILTQKRRRGRPPKVARPEDQLPVVPVPEHLQRLIA